MARTLTPRLQEAGRIRIGDKVESNGKTRPRKLDKFRLTSTNPAALNLAASLYGGQVREWPQPTNTARQWELYTEVNSLDVVVLLQKGCDIAYEQWQGGFCTRRCDGDWITKAPYDLPMVGQACQCEDSPDAPCKLVVRLGVLLPDISGMGTWRIESHGFYTASALKGTLEMLQASMPGHSLVEAVMSLTTETRKNIVDGKPQTFHFPVIGLQPKFTPRQLASGIPNQALLLAAEQQKSLQEHVADIWGDAGEPLIPSGDNGQPLSAQDAVVDLSAEPTPQDDPSVETAPQEQPDWMFSAKATVAILREAEISGALQGMDLVVLKSLEELLAGPENFTPAQRIIRLTKAEKLQQDKMPF